MVKAESPLAMFLCFSLTQVQPSHELWVDDSALYCVEVSTETVVKGVAAFFLEATHVHGSILHKEMCGWRLNLKHGAMTLRP